MIAGTSCVLKNHEEIIHTDTWGMNHPHEFRNDDWFDENQVGESTSKQKKVTQCVKEWLPDDVWEKQNMLTSVKMLGPLDWLLKTGDEIEDGVLAGGDPGVSFSSQSSVSNYRTPDLDNDLKEYFRWCYMRSWEPNAEIHTFTYHLPEELNEQHDTVGGNL